MLPGREWRFGPIRHHALDSVPPRVPTEEGTMDRVDETLLIRIEGAAEESPPTGPSLISRRAAIGGAFGGALVTLLARPDLAMAGGKLANPFGLLLRGRYKPVTNGPDLGLSTVDLSDGSYSKTKIYPAFGMAGHSNVLKPIGDFYTQFAGNLAAYDLPGGAIAMQFTMHSNIDKVSDGHGGKYWQEIGRASCRERGWKS